MRKMFSLKQLEEIANARVESLVEGGTLENAQPIYFHPVTLTGTNTRVSLIILNNSATPFTKTSLKQFMLNLSDARFLISGYFNKDNVSYVTSYILIDSGEIKLTGLNLASNTDTVLTIDIENDFTSLNDGVNKIN
ncbi:MAG: hypothetical protein J6S67_05500 [Methanobrevibacter sp.]|nr:hypothetical protein [Methanobrevibacter sp.]